ncbi:sulfatase [Sphingomonas sp. G-3-2-10]|uniref:sulfatase n=1 Tax=Sphingomonas sp. G-3-2-10 TaxID=2728838 RepID=UPI0019D23F79|nr:sulfatase [Sphingomonas sp. G-3-2-10]
MNRRQFLNATMLTAVTAGAAFPAAVRAGKRAHPNILLILVDDLKPALHGYGDSTAISPNIDRLMRRGTAFGAAYANQAVCAPSRFNLMTGSRSTSTGIYDFGVNLRDVLPNVVTMPQHFLAAGYRTESMGKVYHIGHGTHDDKLGWSVPHLRDKLIEYHDPASTGGVPTREEALFEEVPGGDGDPFVYARTLAKGAAWEATDLPDDAYADGRTAAYASGRLAALKGQAQPFFLAVGFARPHMPFSVPRRYWDLYDPASLPMPGFEQLPAGAPDYAGKKGGEIEAYREVPAGVLGADFDPDLKRKLVHGYYASVSYVDAQIGKVLDALEREGLAEDTIVVLWGDHGFHLGDHGLWTKHTNFEQATRIPLIFAGLGVGAGKMTGQLAETVDIFPTLAALAGIAAPAGPQPIDGISLAPVLRDPGKRVRDHAYHAYPRGEWMGQAIRTERYRLVRWTSEKSGARSWELYDLIADPLETRNIADAAPDTRAHLDAILDHHPAPKKPMRKAA